MSTLLLATLLISAQTKVAPKMKKGMKKVYVTESTISIASKQPVNITQETVFEVTDATDDGYILDVYVTDVKNDATDAESRIYSMATEMLKGVHTRYATDKDGKVTKILDAEKVKKRINETLDKMLSDESLPEGLDLSKVREQLTGELNEETLTESLKMSTSPLTLNGKTISTGTEEEFHNQQGIKMKRTYTLNTDGSIQASSIMDMNTEEMRKLVLGLLEKMGLNLTDKVLESMGTLLKNIKVDASENSTYCLQKDGWVKSIVSKTDTKSMGMSFTITSKVTLK